MAARTYLPTLRLILRKTDVYISNYQSFIEAHLTPSQIIALGEFIVCLANLISALGPQPVED